MEVNRRKMPLPGKILIITALLLCLVFAAVFLLPLLGKGGSSLQRHLDLGQRYLDELDYDAAVLEFTSAIEIDDRSVPAYVGRGQAYLGLEEYPQAEQDFTVVIETLDAENVDSYVGRAQSYIARGETDKALEDIDRAEENGLPQEEADDLRQQAENGPSRADDATDGETARRVLTADDVTWILEPAYVYQDLEPIPLTYSSIYSWSTEDYSPLPQLYQAESFINEYSQQWFDIIDMTSMTTLSEQTLGTIYAGYPFVAPKEMSESGEEPPYLCLGDSPNSPELFYPSADFAGGNIIYGFASFSIHPYCAIYDYSTNELFVEHHNGVGGPPSYTFSPFAEVSSNFVKPVPVYQWQISSALQPGETVLYTPPQYAEYSPECIVLPTDPQDTVFAFVSPDGTLLTDFVYENTVDYSCGIAAAELNGKWGYLDETGTPITDFVYDGIWQNASYPDRLQAFPCTCDTMVVSQNGQMGLLYRDGSVLLDFGEFEDLAPAYNDQLWAMVDGAWGLLDLKDIKAKAGVPTD